MFRKLVSNLPYSPALISEVGFYARRLKDEDVTRRVTVLFVALTFIMQSLAVFSPPESANASSEQDIIRGGVRDLNDFLIRYDHNEDDIKDIYSTVGVSRTEIAAARPGTISAHDNTYIMSRYGQFSSSTKEISMSYQRSAGGVGVRYFSPLAEMGDSSQVYRGWIGKSASLGWFGIVQSNGSLATRGIPTTFSPTDMNSVDAVKTLSAYNLTQNSPAEKTSAKALDKISYTLTLSNPRQTSVVGKFDTRIADILEYSTLIDAGGGKYDQTTRTLSWPQTELAPGQSQERTFVIQLLATMPETSKGTSNPGSYDCRLSLVFGNAHHTQVECPMIKGVEAMFYQLPWIGTGGNLIFMAVLATIVLFFAVRTRQLKKEIRIIRHNFNTGII